MGVYLTNSTAALDSDITKIDFDDIKSPPPKGDVYICLTAPFNAFLVVMDEREMRRLTRRLDGWKPEATYITKISNIEPWLPEGMTRFISYGQ